MKDFLFVNCAVVVLLAPFTLADLLDRGVAYWLPVGVLVALWLLAALYVVVYIELNR